MTILDGNALRMTSLMPDNSLNSRLAKAWDEKSRMIRTPPFRLYAFYMTLFSYRRLDMGDILYET